MFQKIINIKKGRIFFFSFEIFFIFVSVSFKVYLKALKVYEKHFQICLFASFEVSFGSGASKIGEPGPNYVNLDRINDISYVKKIIISSSALRWTLANQI